MRRESLFLVALGMSYDESDLCLESRRHILLIGHVVHAHPDNSLGSAGRDLKVAIHQPPTFQRCSLRVPASRIFSLLIPGRFYGRRVLTAWGPNRILCMAYNFAHCPSSYRNSYGCFTVSVHKEFVCGSFYGCY